MWIFLYFLHWLFPEGFQENLSEHKNWKPNVDGENKKFTAVWKRRYMRQRIVEIFVADAFALPPKYTTVIIVNPKNSDEESNQWRLLFA